MKEIIKLQQIGLEIMDCVILNTVNATVKRGEVIGLIGRNGSGKTTL